MICHPRPLLRALPHRHPSPIASLPHRTPPPSHPSPIAPLPHRTQVKAQIKLKFTTATGRPAVCTRSFSLVQKPSKKEYKAFEAALQTIDERGDKTSLSYKCADLNKLVPEMMHVSTAVLDSVIFVHQVARAPECASGAD